MGERDLALDAGELELRSHSLLVTRYFLRIFSPDPKTRLTDVQARAWFAERERIFDGYTLPSVLAQSKQSKTWLIFIEQSLADLLPKSLTGPRRPPFVEIVEVDSEGKNFFSFRNDISNRINERFDLMERAGVERGVVTVSRVDNDDALSHDFLSTLARLALSKRAAAAASRIVTFPHGLQYLDGKKLGTYLFTNNHFLNSYHTRRVQPTALHAMSFNHSHLFTKSPDTLVINTDLPMWVEIVHGSNVSNRYRSKLALHGADELNGRFGAPYRIEESDKMTHTALPAPVDAGPARPGLAARLAGYVAAARRKETSTATVPVAQAAGARTTSVVDRGGVGYDRMLRVQSVSKAMKPNDFLRAYSRILVAEDVRTMLEIGVHQGGSLKFWRELYGPELKLYGLDLKEECAAFAPEPADKIFIGSQTDTALLDGVARECGPFDVVIDDGSHQNAHMWSTFNHLFKALRPGGIYIVEDMFTSYWERYGGGLRKPESFVERCKQYVDALYAKFMGPNYAKHHKIAASAVPATGPMVDAIESIAFHRCGIVVIRKSVDAKS
jgi:predicted O-methyltransferase YrrM